MTAAIASAEPCCNCCAASSTNNTNNKDNTNSNNINNNEDSRDNNHEDSQLTAAELTQRRPSQSSLRKRKGFFRRLVIRLATCCSESRPIEYEVRPDRPSNITWDEAGITKDLADRGVIYGTQTIPDAPTPFLLYDSNMSRAEGAVVEVGEDRIRNQVDIVALQERLGVIQQRQQDGFEVPPKVSEKDEIEDENQRKQEAAEAIKKARAKISAGAAAAFRAGLAKQAEEEDEDEDEDNPTHSAERE